MKRTSIRTTLLAFLAFGFFAGCDDDKASATSVPAPVVSTDPAALVGSWEITGKPDASGGVTLTNDGKIGISMKMVSGATVNYTKLTGTYTATAGRVISNINVGKMSFDGATWSDIPEYTPEADTATFRIEDGTKLIHTSKGDDGAMETDTYVKSTKSFL
ncbi:MAG: hypothetical protein IPK50_10005 [Fibrobacterota bacterium]|nr:hypothetical protein [Fibrobacterota bacterium]QQS07211.1 MAG: hypothetical protein IPK50_10005 [Fibrobacterota bacterium]